jgi:hypothetical protein
MLLNHLLINTGLRNQLFVFLLQSQIESGGKIYYTNSYEYTGGKKSKKY